jgi:hypothetical protein
MDAPTKDGIYAGDISKWKKFTNTLRLRLLMRVSGRNNDFSPSIGEQINAILSNPDKYPVFESNDDNATVKFSGAAECYKTYFNSTSFSNDIALSGDHHIAQRFLTMIYDAGSGFADPRMRLWIKPRYVRNSDSNTPDQIREMTGAIGGASQSYVDKSKTLGIFEREPYMHYETLVGDIRPNRLFDYDELLFIKSEAAFNSWIPGSAKDYYEAAITASCRKWSDEYGVYASYPQLNATNKIVFSSISITPKDIQAFLDSAPVMWNNTQQRIVEQKWLALFWINGFQMYSEMRRTGYPQCELGNGIIEGNATNGKFIARFTYPPIAIANNRANYLAAFAEQGATIDNNTMDFPVWWSGQAVAKDSGNPWPHTFRELIIADENK